ncbi:MAG TPA: hypothetical protein VK017_07495 [Sphingobacterium sp.]|jgi:hypothetical protein|nr:hypothetical protein [Sphingobacterium sp.]
MRALFAYILLFFYTVTSTGASVYMHLCHGQKAFITEVAAERNHAPCPVCHHEGGKQATDQQHTNTDCCDDGNNCCQDIRVDLSKGEQNTENAPAQASFLTLSPATLTLHWIVAYFSDAYQPIAGFDPPNKELLAYSNPPYLIHCNFRI